MMRNNVINIRGFSQPALPLALLTKRMRFKELGPQALPLRTIATLRSRSLESFSPCLAVGGQRFSLLLVLRAELLFNRNRRLAPRISADMKERHTVTKQRSSRMAITEHEKELIDYASSCLFQTLIRANPFSNGFVSDAAHQMAASVDNSACSFARVLVQTLERINAQNETLQRQIALESKAEAERRAQQTRRMSLIVAGPVALVVVLISEAIKFLFS